MIFRSTFENSIMKTLLLLLFCVFAQSAYSQVTISVPPQIENLILLRKNRSYYGYRIQIGFSSNRNEIEDIRKTFLSEFPEIETNISFEAPYFNLKAGNFRKKIEAETVIKEIQYKYPLANLIKEAIDLPSIN